MRPLSRLLPFVAVLALAACAQGHAQERAAGPPPVHLVNGTDPATQRAGMVSQISAEAHAAAHWTGRPELDQRVMQAFREVPRHRFVPAPLAPYAYLNRPLPVGHGQTVSQPFIVALMAEFADVQPGDRVLLVGLGGGYEAAILATLGAEVQAVELQKKVAEEAMARLAETGYGDRVAAIVGDGYYGAPAQGPYDAIVVRQAVDHLPGPLIRQLKPGGKLVIPKGAEDAGQMLTVVEAADNGNGAAWREQRVLPVRFTYMPGGQRI